jgi:uncharacterized protein (TIGR02145 family)
MSKTPTKSKKLTAPLALLWLALLSTVLVAGVGTVARFSSSSVGSGEAAVARPVIKILEQTAFNTDVDAGGAYYTFTVNNFDDGGTLLNQVTLDYDLAFSVDPVLDATYALDFCTTGTTCDPSVATNWQSVALSTNTTTNSTTLGFAAQVTNLYRLTVTVPYPPVGLPAPVPVPAPPTSGQSMQTLTADQCSAMTIFTGTNTGDVVAMLDNSDGTDKYYAVAKLGDGHCWMISNYAKIAGTKVTNTSSGGSWTSVTGLTAAFYTDPGSASPITGTRVCTGAGYATSAADAIAFLADSGKKTVNSVRNCGYFYNWYGATVGTGTSTLTSTIVTGSICPTGWHLPSAGGVGTAPDGWYSTTEYAQLYAGVGSTYASIVGNSSVFRGVHAGLYSWTSYLTSQGTLGYYWSSSAHSSLAGYANLLNHTESNVYSSYENKYKGVAVRCILDNTTITAASNKIPFELYIDLTAEQHID